eukprot:6213666-Prymnesium_polylepis.1
MYFGCARVSRVLPAVPHSQRARVSAFRGGGGALSNANPPLRARIKDASGVQPLFRGHKLRERPAYPAVGASRLLLTQHARPTFARPALDFAGDDLEVRQAHEQHRSRQNEQADVVRRTES